MVLTKEIKESLSKISEAILILAKYFTEDLDDIVDPGVFENEPAVRAEWRYVSEYEGKRGMDFEGKDHTEEWHTDGGYYRFFANFTQADGTEILTTQSIERFSLPEASEPFFDFKKLFARNLKLTIADLEDPPKSETLGFAQLAIIRGKSLAEMRQKSAYYLTWHRAPAYMKERLSLVLNIHPARVKED